MLLSTCPWGHNWWSPTGWNDIPGGGAGTPAGKCPRLLPLPVEVLLLEMLFHGYGRVVLQLPGTAASEDLQLWWVLKGLGEQSHVGIWVYIYEGSVGMTSQMRACLVQMVHAWVIVGGVGEVWGNGFSFHLFGQFCWNHWMPNYHGISQVAFINKNEGKYSHSICPVQSTILNSFELLWLSPYYTDEANETQTLAEAHVPKPWFELWQSDIRIQIHKHHFSSSVYIQKVFFCVT